MARKAFGLTYSCPVNVEDNPIQHHKELIDFLDGKGVNQYIVGKELHESGKVHWHAYVKYDAIVDSIDPRIFDFKGVHPNIVDGAPGKGWQAYCVKDKDYQSNFYDTNAFKKATLCDNADEAVEMLWQTRPEDMCKHGGSIEENLRRFLGVKHAQKRYDGPYAEEFYPKDWNPETHALLIVGPAGLGKTQFARYLLGDCDYIKGDLEPLRACRFDKPLLFDEVNMLDKHPEQSKEISDVENGGTIQMRYKNVRIPGGIKRIFVHNIEHPFRNPSNAVYGRRVHTHIINGPCAKATAAILAAADEVAKASSQVQSAAAHAVAVLEQFANDDVEKVETVAGIPVWGDQAQLPFEINSTPGYKYNVSATPNCGDRRTDGSLMI